MFGKLNSAENGHLAPQKSKEIFFGADPGCEQRHLLKEKREAQGTFQINAVLVATLTHKLSGCPGKVSNFHKALGAW